jgi:hypothetical protein
MKKPSIPKVRKILYVIKWQSTRLKVERDLLVPAFRRAAKLRCVDRLAEHPGAKA